MPQDRAVSALRNPPPPPKKTAPAVAAASSMAQGGLGGFFAGLTMLQWALAISIALHAVVLSIRFIDPDAINRAFEDTPLEVILVNAKSSVRPEVAQAIAQANLDGGGESAKGRAKSPLPVAEITTDGDAAADQRKRIEEMQETQARLLAQVKAALAARPDEFKSVADDPNAFAEEDQRKQLLKMLAEIEARIDEENKRPRKRFISPATKEAAYAIYYDQLKRKIEARGTSNFPEFGGQKLYGELIVALTVNTQGQLVRTEIIKGSGNRRLDRMAEAIAASAAPFGAFSPEMRKQADLVEVVSRFKFSRDETLKASLEAQQ